MEILTKAKEGVTAYLEQALAQKEIDEQLFATAKKNVLKYLERWYTDEHIHRFSPNFRKGVENAIENGQWEAIVNAYRRYLSFGTGGIRGMMAFDKPSIESMKDPDGSGIDAPILKGPNTINNILLALTATGVAQFGKANGLSKIVIGYDSRVRGFEFGSVVAKVFLGYGYTVYLFDAPCPYPEVTFAIPNESVKADIGVLISASHNDYRYNGFKLSCGNGSQFGPEERDSIKNDYLFPLFQNEDFSASTSQIKTREFSDAEPGQLYFLGGATPEPDFEYCGFESNLINMHDKHIDHMVSMATDKSVLERQKNSPAPINIGFCAYHGAGRLAVPNLLTKAGFQKPYSVTVNGLNDLNGLFPSFPSEPGRERQPDPGDIRAAAVAVNGFKKEYPNADHDITFEDLDIMIGTDPDADRCGIVVQIPENQRYIYDYADWRLIPSDDLWTLLIWYRLSKGGSVVNKEENKEKFLVLSHTTSDSIVKLARKYGVGVVQTWVGFAMLSSAVNNLWSGDQDIYKKYTQISEGIHPDSPSMSNPIVFKTYDLEGYNRVENIAALEQSNGFSILGRPPKDAFSLGEGGHVRDKDGTFAAFLVAELAAYAKDNGTTLYDLIDEKIYLDPDIGLFITGYEPDPLDGEYPGIVGDRMKKNILRRAIALFQTAKVGELEIAGMKVKSAYVLRTGKYDHVYPPSLDFQFPDEGIRLYFDDEKLNCITIRPSGTGNSLRFHTQLHAMINEDRLDVNDPSNKAKLMGKLLYEKERLNIKTDEIFTDLRRLLRAPRKILG